MHGFAHLHQSEPVEASAPKTRGVVITSAWRYDFLMRRMGWFFHERALRQTTADLAHLHPGEAVLDVGCGPGAMAIVW